MGSTTETKHQLHLKYAKILAKNEEKPCSTWLKQIFFHKFSKTQIFWIPDPSLVLENCYIIYIVVDSCYTIIFEGVFRHSRGSYNYLNGLFDDF